MEEWLERLFPVGRRSLLWGVHQFLWHPFTVWLAWRNLYGPPTWRETLAILVHDWGYWWTPDMDGPRGRRHPEFGARLIGRLLGPAYRDLVLYHSRHYAAKAGVPPSRLCWADKLSIRYDPWWWYLLRARLSGELGEYRRRAAAGAVPLATSHRAWFDWLRAHLLAAVQVQLVSGADAPPPRIISVK